MAQMAIFLREATLTVTLLDSITVIHPPSTLHLHLRSSETDRSYIGIITFACECNSPSYRERIIHPTVNIHSIPTLDATMCCDYLVGHLLTDVAAEP